MKEVVIVEGIRTAIGKLGGSLINETADILGSIVIRELLNRTQLDPSLIEEVILGQAKQSADQSNVARLASLRAELPITVPGYTVHRQCGSGLQSINNAAQQIALGYSDIIIAGGTESMSTAPYYLRNARYGYGVGNAAILDPNTESQPGSQPFEVYGISTMGETAENLAEKYSISREEQDAFAHRSQERTAQAIQEGYFDKQIVPYEVKKRKSVEIFEKDEHPFLTSQEKLSTLKPVFRKGGSVTAGNSSGRNDGAAALLIMSKEKALELGYKPKVKILAQAAAGVDPSIMGIGPVPATLKALKQANLSIQDIDIIELNEAFAAQSIAVINELDLDINRVNPNGGAIAMGHPIGATGAILMTKLIYELERTGKRYGLVTLCIAGGLGVTTIVENCQV
ncbi:thiolase family protein [Lysinibacillus sphaericus]|uniref:acetyl-CoA C-acetyltransferase n=1 Tax=Lysinibacillus sphaericus OT4b.31 TaxID=1285586 RepID=R7ZI47_LYSSH|nr:thiolase family protein [Lysinibacillus sphaericus]EON73731.1 acetyl-CoA acetyltransferase [Lysinibacillus sphaericus OT4b.31]